MAALTQGMGPPMSLAVWEVLGQLRGDPCKRQLRAEQQPEKSHQDGTEHSYVCSQTVWGARNAVRRGGIFYTEAGGTGKESRHALINKTRKWCASTANQHSPHILSTTHSPRAPLSKGASLKSRRYTGIS